MGCLQIFDMETSNLVVSEELSPCPCLWVCARGIHVSVNMMQLNDTALSFFCHMPRPAQGTRRRIVCTALSEVNHRGETEEVTSWAHLNPAWTAALSCLVKLQSPRQKS